jgi:hypothetical protein
LREIGQLRNHKWLALIGFLLFLTVGAVACRNQAFPAAALAPGSEALTELESIEQLQEVFNEDAGQPRLLMILAPL